MSQKKAILKLPAPHSKKQAYIANVFAIPDLLELWVACGTKFGKTLSMSMAFASHGWTQQDKRTRWVAPIYSQSKIGMRYIERMLPGKPYSLVNKSEMSINLPYQRNAIEFWHASDPEALEGEASDGYGFDEAAKMDLERVYASAKTTTTVTRAKIAGFSTPRGKNYFYKKCYEARDIMLYQIKNNQPVTHAFITAPTAANPYVPRESIEEARRSLPERLFRQYYLAEFIDDSDVFVGFRDCIYTDWIDTGEGLQFWISPEYAEKNGAADVEVVIGADWAKQRDFTVFTAWDLKQKKMCGFLRFQGVDYIESIKRLWKFCKKFRMVHIVYHDKTGVGIAIDDLLDKTGLPFEGITFTNTNKAEMVNSLLLAFQIGNVKIPYWPAMVNELESYEVGTTALGRMVYNAPSGLHDDIVSSMILGHAALDEFADSSLEAKMLEDLPMSEQRLADWLTDLAEDEEDF